MSRETRINRTIRRALERQTQKIEATKPPRPNRVLKVLAFVIGLPSLYVGIATMMPRISVAPQSPINPADPFSSPFTVKNDGFLPLYDVKPQCALRFATASLISDPSVVQEVIGTGDYSSRFIDPRFTTSVLDPNHSIDAPCAFSWFSGKHLKSADMAVIVSFNPSILPWPHRETMYPFVTVTDPTSGQIRWLAAGSGLTGSN